jgi:hypothetical protein
LGPEKDVDNEEIIFYNWSGWFHSSDFSPVIFLPNLSPCTDNTKNPHFLVQVDAMAFIEGIPP